MYKALKFSVILISALLVFSACEKEDENPNPANVVKSGELTVTIGNEIFTATSVTAREASNGTFIITAVGSDSKVLKFTIANFIGNATYPLGSGVGNNATYSYLVNQYTVMFSTNEGEGFLTITNYNSSEKKFDGVFSFEAQQVGGTSLLFFNDGELLNVPIIALGEAAPGKARVYLAGNYYNVDSAYAQLNNNFSIEVFLFPEGYISPIRIIGLNYHDGGAGTITFGIPYSDGSTQLQYFRPSQLGGEVSMNGDIQNVSGHIAMQNVDFELDYNEIPITRFPMPVEGGELLIKYSGIDVSFNQASSIEDYSQAPETITRRFKATNPTGDSLKFEYSYVGQFQPNYHIIGANETGVMGTLKYYSNGTLVKSQVGYYNQQNTGTSKNYGFDPTSTSPEAMRMRGLNVME